MSQVQCSTFNVLCPMSHAITHTWCYHVSFPLHRTENPFPPPSPPNSLHEGTKDKRVHYGDYHRTPREGDIPLAIGLHLKCPAQWSVQRWMPHAYLIHDILSLVRFSFL